ncbi:MAG: hypothetical protein Q9174_001431 [Haloplaca sp. 1 TL-2023]
MATYGRKKRPIFPGFSVYQDDDPPAKQPHKRSAYTQLGSEDPGLKRPLSRDGPEDSEVDELAGTSSLSAPEKTSSAQTTRSNSVHSNTAQMEDATHGQQASSKPLPSLPSKPDLQGSERNKKDRKVLQPKSVNQKVFNKKGQNLARPKISAPVLVSSTSIPMLEAAGIARTVTTDLSTSDARILKLAQQAEAQEAETRDKERQLVAAESSFRPSPLQRGKSAFITAKHAIAARLGSPKLKFGRTNQKLKSGTGYTKVDHGSETRSIEPLPLPVYESMRSRRESPELQESDDPFSDQMETEADEAWSDFESNANRCKHTAPTAQKTSFQTPCLAAEPMIANDDPPAQVQSPTQYSNKISGLRQHPTEEWFSSSPIGFSTPRLRLEPRKDATGKKSLSAVPVRDPPVLDYGFDQDVMDEDADLLPHSDLDAEVSSTMKRKSDSDDPQSQASKRAKRGSTASQSTATLSMSRGEGFGISDIDKGKRPESSIRSCIDTFSIHGHSRQRSSSMSRPTSVLFSRESRARVPLLKNFQEDEMDVDELQTEDTKMLGSSSR